MKIIQNALKFFSLLGILSGISGCFRENDVIPVSEAPWECRTVYYFYDIHSFLDAYEFHAQGKTEEDAKVASIDKCRKSRQTIPSGCTIELCKNLVTGEEGRYANGKRL